jgi:cholesterol oxidase
MFDYDVIVIGSGFGGSVSGLRLVEKGYRVLMLEKGSELGQDDFPKTNWNLPRWLWMPRLGFRGLFQLRFFRHVTVMAGVGVGGGSLVYANTLPTPKNSFFANPSWAHLADWREELEPHYETARRMLGVNVVPFMTRPDELLREVARDRGQEDRFRNTEVSVFFGEPGRTVPDPYFDGEGPERTGCLQCGACMTGCPHGAKNTLDKNYLYLARKQGLELEPDTEVVHVRPLESGGYAIEALQGRRAWFRKRRRWTARKVIFSAGTLGTVDLLLKLRADDSALPKLSGQLGRRVRTNSESLIGVMDGEGEHDLSRGVAIGSIYEIDEHTHVEVCRFGAGSGFFRTLMAPHVGGQSPAPIKVIQAMLSALRRPIDTFRAYFTGDWAKKTIILLYMQTLEGTLRFRRGPFGFGTLLEEGQPPTASIPGATEIANAFARKTRGFSGSLITETALNIPTTAHILGGCCMGESAEHGVIDHNHQVFGYDGLYVIDGSAISANPGVNPSLTITALAERAMGNMPDTAT